MSEMIERVARAIYSKRNGAGAKPWSRLEKAHKAPYLDDALAAIEAMRLPTAKMLAAGSDTFGEYDDDPKRWDYAAEETIPAVFTAMISAALRE